MMKWYSENNSQC